MSDDENKAMSKEHYIEARNQLLDALNARLGETSDDAEAERQDLRVQIADLDRIIDAGQGEPIPDATGSQDLEHQPPLLSDICEMRDGFGFTVSSADSDALVTFVYNTHTEALDSLNLMKVAIARAVAIFPEEADNQGQ